MNKDVLRAAVRRDEAEAFGGVEEFYGSSLGHGKSSSRWVVSGIRATRTALPPA
jgi:hypothetical protein